MKQSSTCYVVSVQAEPYHKGTRYHWMICCADNADELVSWGHAPTREQAEAAARNEVDDLSAGLTEGGRVPTAVKPFTNRF